MRRRYAIILILIVILSSCKGYRRVVTEKITEETREEVSNIEPFSVRTVKDVETENGVVKDFDMAVGFDGMFEAVLQIIDGEAELTLVNNDTIPLTTTITNKTTADIHPVEYREYSMPKWLRRLLIGSLIVNAIVIVVGVMKIWRRIMMPI